MITCGIDFGTSNSAIAISGATTGRNGKVRLIPVESKHTTLPSAIFYPVGRAPQFGRAAITSFAEGDEGRFMRSLKRMLGTTLMNYGTIVNDKPRRFDEIIGGFISHLKKHAEAVAECSIESVVMGRPVHFVDGDPGADDAAEMQLTRIAQAAGFKHVLFQFEPIAAAFAHEHKLTAEKLALVVDIGGGTSDFTVIRLGPASAGKTDRTQDILGNAGTRIGGNDFDKDLGLAAFMPHFGYKTNYSPRQLDVPLSWFHDFCEWSKINFLYTPKFRAEIGDVLKESNARALFSRYVRAIEEEKGHRVLASIEHCKIRLTEEDRLDEPLPFIEKDLQVQATRATLEDAIGARLDAIDKTMDECLKKSNTRSTDIELIVLTGGPAEMPAIKSMISQRFPNADLSEEEKLSSVASGLGHDSARRFNS